MGLESGGTPTLVSPHPIPALAICDLAPGLPADLRAMGMVEADLEGLPARAERDHCNATDPRPAVGGDYARPYREALA
jgi:hypothetical protein